MTVFDRLAERHLRVLGEERLIPWLTNLTIKGKLPLQKALKAWLNGDFND